MVKVIFIIVSKNEYLRVTFAEEIRGNIIKKKYLEWWLCGSGGGLGLYLEAAALDGLILKTSTPSKRETNCDVYYAIFSRFALQQYFKVAIFPLCLFFLIQTMGWRRGLKRDARLEKKVEKRKICVSGAGTEVNWANCEFFLQVFHCTVLKEIRFLVIQYKI